MCSWLDISIMSIPPFHHSAIPLFRHSAIPPFRFFSRPILIHKHSWGMLACMEATTHVIIKGHFVVIIFDPYRLQVSIYTSNLNLECILLMDYNNTMFALQYTFQIIVYVAHAIALLPQCPTTTFFSWFMPVK